MTKTIAGKDMLVKADINGDGNFITIAGAQTRTLTMNGNLIDITNQDSEGNWREAVAGVDIKSMTLAIDGILPKGITFATLDDIYRNQIGGGFMWQVLMPGLAKYEGRFVLTTLEFTGEQNNVVRFSATLESSSVVDKTALAA